MNTKENRFCIYCGTVFSDDAAFCGECGAARKAKVEPVVETVIQPEPAAQEPVFVAPVEEFVPVSAPVYTPVAPAAAPTIENNTFRFPIAPLILTGVAFFFFFLNLSNTSISGITLSSILVAFSLLSKFAAYVLAVVGLIVCRKQRNLLVSIGLMVVGFATLLFGGNNFLSRMDSVLPSIMRNGISERSLGYLSFLQLPFIDICTGTLLIGMGVCYMIGKPVMGIIKMVCAILVMVLLFFRMFNVRLITTDIIEQIEYFFTQLTNLSTRTIMTYLFGSALPMVAVILYTPFKKD